MKVELTFTLNYNSEAIPAKEENKEEFIREHVHELTDLLLLHLKKEDPNTTYEVKVNGR